MICDKLSQLLGLTAVDQHQELTRQVCHQFRRILIRAEAVESTPTNNAVGMTRLAHWDFVLAQITGRASVHSGNAALIAIVVRKEAYETGGTVTWTRFIRATLAGISMCRGVGTQYTDRQGDCECPAGMSCHGTSLD
jgi:hypothetical protein